MTNKKHAWSEESIAKARKALKERLSGHAIPKTLVGLQKKCKELYELLNRTVAYGESNTCMLIGPSGCGKTTLVNKVLQELSEKYDDDFCTVYLNGLYQTNDTIARKQLTRQLGIQIRQNQTDLEVFDLFKSGNNATKPIIIIIYNFDEFVKNCTKPFVYNFFNITMIPENCPMALIGITRKLSIFTDLPSNILSRNSYSHINVERPYTIEVFTQLAKSVLTIDNSITNDKKYCEMFNKKVQELFENKSFKNIIEKIFNNATDIIRTFQKICFEPVGKMNMKHPFLILDDFTEAVVQQDVKIDKILQELHEPQLWILLAIHSLGGRDCNTFNFAMVYNEYTNYIKSYIKESGSKFKQKLIKEHLLRAEFEFLEQRAIIRKADGKDLPKDFRMMRLTILHEQIVDVVSNNNSLPSLMKQWIS
ncbi:origin recognition complex subunit 4 C-terminus-domain-containing protein [Glomus cerebriforme]|uniref:Origin recognition complex subunit 4 C-terminus-domain-containing protein n=1 Tax=Glomus cerebriforme TaxID=658196 RepID=A0A397T403_9GLOM|nr:origin recognition complex subunit 4 C-terminus-domain-containing protein [Glomus cerebriforme]